MFNKTKLKFEHLFVLYFVVVFHLQFIGNFLGVRIGISFQMCLILTTSLLMISRNKKYWKIINNKNIKMYFLAILLFFLFAMLSLMWTRSQNYGFNKVFMFLFKILTMFLAAPILLSNKKIFFSGFIALSILIILAIILKYGNPFQLLTTINRFERFGTSANTNPIIIGRYFGMISIIFFMAFFNTDKLYYKFLFLPFFLISIVYTLTTGSRGPTFSFALSILFYFIFNGNRSGYWKNILIPFFIFVIILGSNHKIVDYYNKIIMGDFVQERFFNISEKSDSRIDLVNFAVDNYINSNLFRLIFGNGAGDFGFIVTGQSDTRVYPHNIFLEVVFEYGLFGFGIFIYIIISMFYTVWQNRKKGSYVADMFFTLSIYFLFNSFVSADLPVNTDIFFFHFLFLISIGNKNALINSKGTNNLIYAK